MRTPASVYLPSFRPFPDKIPTLIYPDRFEVRYVSADGAFRWNSDWVQVSIICSGEYIGFEEIDDGVRNMFFGLLKLGRFHE
jgi:putative transposase